MKKKDRNLFREKYSKKHHYLPVFYLKGFADAAGKIHVYDKIKDEILPNQNPESKFYVNHLNNYKFDGEVKFTLEEYMMNGFDSKGSKLFEKIKASKFHITDPLSSLEKFELIGFLQKLYWRHPTSSDVYVELIKKEGLSNKYFAIGLKDSETQLSDDEIPEIKQHAIVDSEIQKVLKMVMPFQGSALEEAWYIYDKFKIFGIESDIFSLITGDFPFLIKNYDRRMNNVFGDFIFPISKSRLLACTTKSPDFLDSLLITRINNSILHLSTRFVACESETKLRKLVLIYKEFLKKGLEGTILKDVFDFIHFQSNFADYATYNADMLSKHETYLNKNL